VVVCQGTPPSLPRRAAPQRTRWRAAKGVGGGDGGETLMPLAAARRAGIGCAFVGVWEGRRGSRSGRAGRRAGLRGGKGSGEGNGGAPAALFATGRPVGNGGQRLALLALGRGGGCGCALPWPG